MLHAVQLHAQQFLTDNDQDDNQGAGVQGLGRDVVVPDEVGEPLNERVALIVDLGWVKEFAIQKVVYSFFHGGAIVIVNIIRFCFILFSYCGCCSLGYCCFFVAIILVIILARRH